MDFNRSDDHRLLAESLSRYLHDNYSHSHRMESSATDTGYSPDSYTALCELGIVGALLPESCGGYGGGGYDISVVFEELGKALVVEPLLSTAVMCGNLLADLSNDTHRELIEQIIKGSTTVALANYEPGSRYQLDHINCTATKNGDHWVLHGHKNQILNAGTADYFIVIARSDKQSQLQKGLSCYLIPKDTPGLSINSYPTIDGYQSGDISLENAKNAILLGSDGNAYNTLEKCIARANLALCAEAYGAMTVCKELTIEYLQTRKQFGVEIGKFQVLQHRMVDVLIEIEQAKSSVINAASHIDDSRATRESQISATKNLIGRTAKFVAEESIQLHGGIAMTWEYSLSHYAKRLVMIDHLFGDTDYHLQRYIEFTT